MRSYKRVKKTLIWTLVIGCLVTYLTIIWPGTKRYFLGYWHFRVTADYHSYPKTLPKSAHNMRYYVYEFLFTDKSGFRATFSPEDYELIKRDIVEEYMFETSYELYAYDGITKNYLDLAQVEALEIDYLDQLLPTNANVGDYYFLGYWNCDCSSYICYEGVLCNDETCEIIAFCYNQNYGW